MHKIPAFAEKHAKAGFFLKTAAPSHGEFLCENTCPAADLFPSVDEANLLLFKNGEEPLE